MAYRPVGKDVPPRSFDPQGDTALLSPEQLAKLRAQIDRGHKIEAIKLLRDATGLGLKESKDAVERMKQP